MTGASHIEHRAGQSAPVVPTPAGTSRARSLILPAFWMLLALLVIGTVRISSLVSDAFTRYPVATVTAAILFALYAIPFVIVARSVDFFEREPPLLLMTAMLWG